MRVLLLSAYHAPSHDNWLQGLQSELADIQWTVLTLPPRHFSWRIRGNPLSWFSEQRAVLNEGYDRLIATSTVDLATLRGLVPALARIPTAVYFHENQFAYPRSDRARPAVEPQMVNLYSALAADALWFNSHYNRESFFAGCRELCARLPDHVPSDDWFEALSMRAEVLPVPLTPLARDAQEENRGPLRVVWNHRWEYDKGVDRLLAALRCWLDRGLEVELTLLGQRFRQCPAEREALLSLLSVPGPVRLCHDGFVDHPSRYRALLAEQQVVLSTSLHDFQGLSVMEAAQLGCRPLLPRRLCYPEFFEAAYLYDSIEDDIDAEAAALSDRLQSWMQRGLPEAPDLTALTWPSLRDRYRQAIESLAEIP